MSNTWFFRYFVKCEAEIKKYQNAQKQLLWKGNKFGIYKQKELINFTFYSQGHIL